jgi:hypothetical protein
VTRARHAPRPADEAAEEMTAQHVAAEDDATPHPATIRSLYDEAMARAAVPGHRALQRYLAVLATPRST